MVTETFFSLLVLDMARATAFYVGALGATVLFATPIWTSLHIAGVRVGLVHVPGGSPGRTGLHFAVSDLDETRAAIARAGGNIDSAPEEVAPGVVVAEAMDTEGNSFALRGS